jgi:hypothetical protein
MDLKVIEPINKPFQEFKTTDEFNLFYQKNKETMDATTTHKLNRMYKIDGYRITKIKGILSLKKFTKSYYTKQTSPLEERIANLEECYSSMNEQLNEIEDKLDRPIEDDRVGTLQKEIQSIRTSLTEIIRGLKANNMFN